MTVTTSNDSQSTILTQVACILLAVRILFVFVESCDCFGLMEASAERTAVAISNFKAKQDSDKLELPLQKGDQLIILLTDETTGWWKGRISGTNREGWFPKKCVKESVSWYSTFW